MSIFGRGNWSESIALARATKPKARPGDKIRETKKPKIGISPKMNIAVQ